MSYGLSPIPGVESRVHEKLHHFSSSVELQKERLKEAEDLVLRSSHVQGYLKSIHKATHDQFPKLMNNVGDLAEKVQHFAEETQQRSTQLRKLHVFLKRVDAARVMANSLLQLERSANEIEAVKEANDLPRMVAVVLAYEAAKAKIVTETTQPPHSVNGGDLWQSTLSTYGSSAEETGENSQFYAVSSTLAVKSVREQCVKMLTEKVQEANASGDRELLLSCMSFLVQLGYREMATEVFGGFLCQHVIHNLRVEVVDVELSKMNTPHAAVSHLVLLSRVLDAVAGTIEDEKDVTRRILSRVLSGSPTGEPNDFTSPLKEGTEKEEVAVNEGYFLEARGVLLEMLHKEATSVGEKIVDDFFHRRKGVIKDLEEAVEHRCEGKKKSGLSISPHPGSSSSVSSVPSSSTAPQTTSASAFASVSRRADQFLEDISHITSCCHAYFEFYANNTFSSCSSVASTEKGDNKSHSSSFSASLQAQKSGESPVAATAASSASGVNRKRETKKEEGIDYLWASMDNPLLRSAQQLLSHYCPVQLAYFQFTFSQAMAIQQESLNEKLKTLQQASAADLGKGKNSNRGVNAASTSAAEKGEVPVVLYHLRELYEQSSFLFSSSTSTDDANNDLPMMMEHAYYLYDNLITLPEDVFYVLRIALHRAFHTKSTQIIYAVLPYIEDVLQSSLLVEIERQVEHWSPEMRHRGDADEGSSTMVLSPRVLRWICAANTSVGYTLKLSEELLRLGTTTYSGAVLQRLKEHASDFESLGKFLKRKAETWLKNCATELWKSKALGKAAVEKLMAQDYVLTEDQLFFLEVHDPWAQALLVSSEEILAEIRKMLDQDTFDQFLVHFSQVMVGSLREVLSTKKFNSVGSLQVDKEIRGIRHFFSSLAQKSSLLRDAFSPLTLIASLLLVETPQDALDELHNTALTWEEKKMVLLQRVEFTEKDVLSLKL